MSFPLAVLKVLARQATQIRSRTVLDRQFRGEVYDATGRSDPVIELVVLVADKGFVEQAHFIEDRTLKDAEIHRVCFSWGTASAERGISGASS